MQIKKKQPPLEWAAQENTRPEYYTTKKFPPFGKQLNDLRHNGQIPYLRIMVTTDWRLCELYPRIVIPFGSRINELIFDYLSGLSVQIVYHDGEDDLVEELTEAIVEVNPRTLVSFNIDVAKQRGPRQSVFTLIYPEVWKILL